MKMRVYSTGLAGVTAFYAVILGFVVWVAATSSRNKLHRSHDNTILSNRRLGLFVGIFSLVASWIGGGFISGTAEGIYSYGLAWCQLPVGYSLSLFFGALLFVKPMRKAEHVTMLDPFQQRYGAKVGGSLFLPALCGDLIWCGAVIRALGASLSTIAGVDSHTSVCASVFLAAIYTICGGFYTVNGIDALQLLCIIVGLTISVPFAVLHPAVSLEKNLIPKKWIGEVKNEDLSQWIDQLLMLIFGGIPWQSYFQRILSTKSVNIARTLSIASALVCALLAVPSAIIGMIARSTDWSFIDGYNEVIPPSEYGAILPLVLRYLTPPWISFIGLGALSAAVLSAADSSIIASCSMFTRNIYRIAIRPKASDKELDWILRIVVVIAYCLSALVALSVSSVYYLSFLSSDLLYVTLFPQLLSVIHWPSKVDSYGCMAGYIVAIAMRAAGGEKQLGVPILIKYPYFDSRNQIQKFPFRTVTMISSLVTSLVVSFFTRNLLGKRYLPRCCDILGVYTGGKANDRPPGVMQSHSGAALIDAALDSSNKSGDDNRSEMSENRESSDDHIMGHFIEPVTDTIVRKANRSIKNLQNLRSSVQPTPQHSSHLQMNEQGGQLLGVRNYPVSMGNYQQSEPMPHKTPMKTPLKMNGIIRDPERLELNLNLQDGSTVRRNVKGVKLVGMDSSNTLRRTSLHYSFKGAFSPTPSVEMVHILDRRQSNGSFGPGSLSPVPGIEACKTHGTAMDGQTGAADHCKIKRGIVRHHSFNESGDRIMMSLARQPTYPSMPLRGEADGRMTLVKRDDKAHMGHSSGNVAFADDRSFHLGTPRFHGVHASPYTQCGFSVKNQEYFMADDEAMSRF